MQKYKKLIFISVTIVAAVIFAMLLFSKKDDGRNSIITDELIGQINEKYFDVELNLDSRTIVADDKVYSATDFFNISEEKLQELIDSGELSKLLNEKLIGNVETNENVISVDNPFSTKSLIVEVKDSSTFKSYKNIKEVKHLLDNIYIVRFESSTETKQGYEDLASDLNIKKVVKDSKVSIAQTELSTSAISEWNMAWGVKSTGLNHYASKMNYLGGEEVKIGVFDTGINKDHEVFHQSENVERIYLGDAYDYINEDNDPTDDNGHGTFVSGIIAESTSDNVKIIPVKIMDKDGKGIVTAMLDAITDLYSKVDIINLSLGMDAKEIDEDTYEYMDAIIKNAHDHGTIVVCASGNDGAAVRYPACSAYTLTAGAIDSNGRVSSFSDYGPTVDFALPGESLRMPSHDSNNGYKTRSGTSFACPFLSSAIAMVKTEHPSYGETSIVNVLKENAIDSGDEGKDDYYGYGSINFNYNMFSSPSIINCSSQDSEWKEYNSISLYAIASKKITSYGVSTSDEVPTTWYNVQNQDTELAIDDIRLTSNGTYYLYVKDEDENISEKATVQISFVDSSNPSVTTFSKASASYNNISISISAEDVGSGISEVRWFYKKSSDSEYSEIDEVVEAAENNQIAYSQTFNELDNYTEYEFFAEIYDQVGNCTTTSKINVKTLGQVNIVNKTGNIATVACSGEKSSEDYSVTYSEDTLTVTCSDDYCVYALNENEDACVRLEPMEENSNKYRFDGANNVQVVVALKGDANLNGLVNVMDAMKIINIIKGLQIDKLSEQVADVNMNNSINVMDAMEIINIIKNT